IYLSFLNQLRLTIENNPPTPPPAVPGAPTSNSPQCGSVTLNAPGTPPIGVEWYWQTSAAGTSMTDGGPTYTVTSGGTYYLRAYETATSLWSAGAGSHTVTVHANPTVTAHAGSVSVCNGDMVTLYGS